MSPATRQHRPIFRTHLATSDRRAGEDMFERVTASDSAFQELYDASTKWLERGDH